jgi:hypothetical protein
MNLRHEVFRRERSTPHFALRKKKKDAVAPEPDVRGRIAGRRALGLGALASLFAFIGRSAARAADALTIDPNGKVNIDNLSVQKSLRVAGPVQIDGKNALELGAGITKEQSAGQIAYQKHSGDALDIVGAGTEVGKRKISMWAEGGAALAGGLTATGTVKAQSLETNSGISLAGVQNAVSILIPVGTIMAYGGDTRNNTVVTALNSQGWLPCDGRAYAAQEYPELAKVIGNSFGNLRVPDLRGRFLRGTDQGATRDPDTGSRRPENGGNAGDNVGSVQDDEFRSHQHQYTLFPGRRGGIASGDYWSTNDNAQTGPAGGNETRPKNVYVNWIIRAK